jgi:DNA-binding FrmR family transcriptional regulator
MPHDHHHPVEERRANIHRLRRIVGQLNGVEKMLGEDRDCSEILMQIISARKGLKALSERLIHGHLHHCVEESQDRKDGAKKLKELLTVLERYVE